MSYMNSRGYLNRKKGAGKPNKSDRKIISHWFIKSHSSEIGALYLGYAYFPKSMIGKRVRIKIEEVLDK